MRKQFAVLAAVIIAAAAAGAGCKKQGAGMEDFSGALNLQYKSYRIIKDNKDEPARAGKLFTEYYKANRTALAEAFKRYYKKFGDGTGLSEKETAYLKEEMLKVETILSDKDIKKVMDDPAFIENAREGTRILAEIREKAQ